MKSAWSWPPPRWDKEAPARVIVAVPRGRYFYEALMEENPLYKKIYFQCARRAMLENELVMRGFAEEVAKNSYPEEKLVRLDKLLTEMFDNDMFDLIMGQKSPEFFKEKYDLEICRDMASYAAALRSEGRSV